MFPNKRDVKPRYDQITLDLADRHNKFQQILSPNPDDEGVWIHQDAWFHLGKLDEGVALDYSIKKAGNGLYAFVLEGDITIDGQTLNRRDGFGVWDTDKVSVKANSDAEVLLMEVPMNM